MQLLKDLYFKNRFFLLIGINVLLFLLGFSFSFLVLIAKVCFIAHIGMFLIDLLMLFRVRSGVHAERKLADKLSNGDKNEIWINLENRYKFNVDVIVIDEVPEQFQARDIQFKTIIEGGKLKKIKYYLRPVKRGEYFFGKVNVFVSTKLGLIKKRYSFPINKMVPVYPSYIQLRKYSLMAISNRLQDYGIKQIRRLGHNMEFDQIKDYIPGDDFRTINWKATSRSNKLMVNQYQDERSQQVFSVIDKGRVMKMPFEGLSLMDYAINASLVIANIAISKEDKAGLITFSNKISNHVAPKKNKGQMRVISETLFNQKTGYRESDYEILYTHIKRNISQRSLIIIYTNFETLANLNNQIGYFRKIASLHLVVVIFFENTELKTMLESDARSVEEIYVKTIAEKFAFEKKQVVKELQKYGIHAVLTAPKDLTVNTINKYLELKARGMI